MRKFCLLATLFVLSACGSKLNGEYGDKLGIASYNFKSGNKVYISALGIETEGRYEIDGNKVKVENNGQNLIFTILNDGSIDTGFGMLKKKQ